jgi:predicted dehydrogenase
MERMTRRAFLEQSGRAVMGAAAGLTVLRAWSHSPNDTIGVAVIGLNGQGKAHIRHFSEIEGVRLVALCDVDERVLQQAGAMVEQRTGARPKLYTDLRQLLEDKAVDAVSTATPNHWHALLTIWACQAGKDVYVEKPACWSFEEGERMIEAARKYNRIVQVGHQTRSDPVTRLAVQRAWAGEIGKIYMSRGLCYKPRGPIGFQKDTDPPPWLHWELWQGPATRRPFNPNYVHYNWHWFWNYGNGDIGNQGVHQVDIARWFLNKRYPVKVHSVGGRYGYEDQGETPNTQIATFEYEDGTLLVFEVRGLFTNDEQGAKIGNLVYGSLGYMSSGDGYKPRRSPQEALPERENLAATRTRRHRRAEPLPQLYSGGALPPRQRPPLRCGGGRHLGAVGASGEYLVSAGTRAALRPRPQAVYRRPRGKRHAPPPRPAEGVRDSDKGVTPGVSRLDVRALVKVAAR